MFRRAILTGLLFATFVWRAFALPIIPDSADSVKCNVETFGKESGPVLVRAIWYPVVSGEITLDSKIYSSASDETGSLPIISADPVALYSKYNNGFYTDSSATDDTKLTQLTSLPTRTGYDFNGFYTAKYEDGVKVIDNTGNFMEGADTVISEAGIAQTWYAQWTRKQYLCAAGQYLTGNAECETCTEGHYCNGGDITYSESGAGIESCTGDFALSDAGASSELECYRVSNVICSTKNPYTYGHGTAVYGNADQDSQGRSVAECREYNGSESGCVQVNDDACLITSLNCESGYEAQTVDGELRCVVTKITCEPGTYLPANSQACEVCPANSYCEGGEYDVLHENVQGITASCESPLQSPAGSQRAEDCGRVLHVDDALLYLHSDKPASTPAFAVEVDGQVWYADMTPVSEGEKPVSSDTTKTMHVKVGNTEYTVHGRYVK